MALQTSCNPLLDEYERSMTPKYMDGPYWLRGARAALDTYEVRDRLRSLFSYAVPSNEAIALVAQYSPLVEIGAGTGYWASLVANAGADIVAYDLHPPVPGHNNSFFREDSRPFFNVRQGDVDVLARHGDRALFMVWPYYGDEMASRALNCYSGPRIVYIGEGHGGCCAEEEFFDALPEHGFSIANTASIPQWSGMHDCLFVYERSEDR